MCRRGLTVLLTAPVFLVLSNAPLTVEKDVAATAKFDFSLKHNNYYSSNFIAALAAVVYVV